MNSECVCVQRTGKIVNFNGLNMDYLLAFLMKFVVHRLFLKSCEMYLDTWSDGYGNLCRQRVASIELFVFPMLY